MPLYLTTAAASGHRMKKYLGFNYSPYLFYYKDNYSEGSYDAADFPKLWRIMGARLFRSPLYLIKIRRLYNKIFKAYGPWFKKIRTVDAQKFTDQELLNHFIRAGHSLIDSIDLAHVIEIVSLGLELDLKRYLNKKYSPPEVNKRLRELTNFYQPSFINQEESDLKKLKGFGGSKLKLGLRRHASEYYWFRTNYTGSQAVDVKYLQYRLKQLSKQKRSVAGRLASSVLSDKDPQFKKYVGLIIQVADWQDERKANIFKAIYHTQKLVKEISRRLAISVADLHYLAAFELLNLKNLGEIKKLKPILRARRQGCFDWISYQKEVLVSGAEFRQLEKYYHSFRSRVGTIPLTIEGTVANSGRVIGPVRLCKSLSDITKVKQGDIIVTSMTRPEFLVAIKKAAGIVTDEGGITCHAAIVSRELGIPCIIGTKIATKALKNGDWVEVNANHGVVMVIEHL